ncbi:T9SS type A sorting domain-containing protein [Chitinophaga agrisoli]|uniref:T9SS type A sorting domain-containing protein n=1 Tax=Chitinophaga agrisoli TaxID=2607653 RepID=A0A5B2VQ70_9BACT|nr:T9SS type A sorting domain-containing protein [Chitinophaga agrisoli]KAA2240249.1 T9SS type A sorting domain-containing protein [Chitinophaga agrisoli]
MKIKPLKYLLSILLLSVILPAFAQQDTYIPPGGQAWLFGNAPAAMYGNMQLDGTLGSSANAQLYFMGKKWTNGNSAALPDESANGLNGTGGMFRFSSANMLYGNTGQQTVYGGYNVASGAGVSFPNLEISNGAGLLLDDLSDLKVRNTLNFASGHIFLNGWNLVVGQNNPGTITGYSDQRFVVNGGGVAGGFLYREGLSATTGRIVFPVGTAPGSYSPAAVDYKGAPDIFHVRVFDDIYAAAISGAEMQDTFINKTWNVGHVLPGSAPTDVILQHMNAAMEMPVYADNRDSSYITRFGNGTWDRLPVLPFQPQSGTLTTQAMGSSATMHLRRFTAGISPNEYFSKTVLFAEMAPPAQFIEFNAWRATIDFVQLKWSTSREVNNAVFEIQRRLENETDFTTVARVPTQAPGGYSNVRLDYPYQDANDYDGWSYYRIKAVSRTGQVTYTDIKPVPPLIQIDVYPNPNFGQFHVRIRGIRAAMKLQVINTWGQQLRMYNVERDADIAVRELPASIYYLVLSYEATQVIAYRTKVVVIGQK